MSIRHSRRRWAGAFLALTLAACGDSTGPRGGEPVSGPGDYAGFVRSDGRSRRYELHVPPQYDGARSLPLVLAFHGVPGTPADMRAIGGLDAVADARGFIVAYPQSATGDWDLNCGGCTLAEQQGVDDVRLVRDLVSQLRQDARVDPARVYVAGFSQGALLAHHLSCVMEGTVRGFASVAATMLAPTSLDCAPPGGADVLFVHGSADAEFPVEGRTVNGLASLSLDRTLQEWRINDGCSAAPTVQDLPDAADDGTTTRRESYEGCATGRRVVLYRVSGGGHTWPGSPAELNPALGPESRDFSAAQAIADFFGL